MSLRHTKLAAMIVIATGTVACLDGNIPSAPSPALWEGELVPSSPDRLVSGSIAAVVESSGTRIGIGMRAAESTVFEWSLNRGSCGMDPEPIISNKAFPPLIANEEGLYSTGAFLTKRLLPNGEYRVLVTPASADAVVACGNLHRR